MQIKKKIKERSILNKVKDCISGTPQACSTCENLKVELSLLKRQVKELAVETQNKSEEATRFRHKYKEMKKIQRVEKRQKCTGIAECRPCSNRATPANFKQSACTLPNG